jgi:hypothetical protein
MSLAFIASAKQELVREEGSNKSAHSLQTGEEVRLAPLGEKKELSFVTGPLNWFALQTGLVTQKDLSSLNPEPIGQRQTQEEEFVISALSGTAGQATHTERGIIGTGAISGNTDLQTAPEQSESDRHSLQVKLVAARQKFEGELGQSVCHVFGEHSRHTLSRQYLRGDSAVQSESVLQVPKTTFGG